MSFILGLVFFIIELVFGCHCAQWIDSYGEWRCAKPAYRCEFLRGYHWTQPGVALDCTQACGPT